MSALTPTANLGLYKPNPGTAETFRSTDFNSNMDKIDAAMGLPYVDFTPTTVNTSTVETQVMGTTVPPPLQGTAWKLTVAGTFGHTATPTTLTLRVKLGGTTVSTMTITTPASALSGKAWRIDAELTTLTLGGSGTWKLSGLGFATVNTTDTPFLMSPAAVTKDTTISNTFEVTAQWAASNVANTITADAGQIYRITNG